MTQSGVIQTLIVILNASPENIEQKLLPVKNIHKWDLGSFEACRNNYATLHTIRTRGMITTWSN
jgi:hypothetical protein